MTHPSSSLDCEAVVVNYNAGPLLCGCVASILAAGASRVVVADNASSDESLARLDAAGFGDRVQVIRNADNLGFAKACNVGLAATSAPWILFLNPDGALDSDALRLMIEALRADPCAGMAGALVRNTDGSEQRGCRRDFPTPGKAFAMAFGLTRFGRLFPGLARDFQRHGEPLPPGPSPVQAVSGSCMLVRREAVQAVGAWDEGYFLHCEDLDWCMRFHLGGWSVLFVPEARVTHVKGACGGGRLFVEWHKHKGMARFYRKFYRDRYPAALWWLVAAGVWLRFGLLACAEGVRALSRARRDSRG